MGLIDPLLEKISSLLAEEYGKLTYLQSGITSLRCELRSIKAALEDLSHLEESSSLVKEWKGQLQELSHDIEDCIDDFVQRLGQDDVHDGLIGKITGWLKTMRLYHDTAGQIAKLKEHAVEVNDRRKRLKLDITPSCSSTVAIDPRLSALFEEADRLEGTKGPKDELVKLLTEGVDSLKQRRVISIVGFGGLGKTTLANLVYKNIKSKFHCTAFVSVSRNPDINKILKDILLGVLETSNPTSDDQRKYVEKVDEWPLETDRLIHMIKEYLKIRRYFVVIDDIWCRTAWDTIQRALPLNDSASQILTTTRINDVAIYSCLPQKDYVYSIKPLSSHDSRILFFKRIFCLEKECSKELIEIADEILKKCDGLPLAIINIASLLATKAATRQEWKTVLDSIGCAIDKYHELELIKRVLLVSYRDLPHHLKICLLYLSVFPEDHTIYRDQLIWRWIAEGFIVGRPGQNLEEVGESYFNELANRNMIQLVVMGYGGGPVKCRVHDIILDLLISLSTEENFVTILNGEKYISSSNRIRRLSLQGNCEDHNEWLSRREYSHVRSLNVFGDCKNQPLFRGLKFLRVLDINDFSQKGDNVQLTEVIGSLRFLRYLRFTKVPREIGNLKLLRTLDLSSSDVEELPATIVQLHQLVRLFLPPNVKFPNGISNLTSLQELGCFSCLGNSVGIVLELGNLIKLEKLHIFWDDDGTNGCLEQYKEALVSSLRKLGNQNIQSLEIWGPEACNVDFSIDSWFPPPRHLQNFESNVYLCFHKIPRRISSFSALICLRINVQHVEQDDLQPLKDLPVLECLELRRRRSNQELESLTISGGGFRCLKTFRFSFLLFDEKTGGPCILFEEGAMPKLQQLEIDLPAIAPDIGIRHLTFLKHLQIHINCWAASACEVEATEATMRSVATGQSQSQIPHT
ncbi:hypothetical protein ACQ4PT_017019 [Festuca glaucescens]